MRLLQLSQHGEVSLTKDLGNDVPRYAILSHTWGADDDEVTFDDLEKGLGKSKAGYTKLRFCGNQARKDKIDYFWVDTCCINKANHSELAEAIASMFRWYRNAVNCYVFLSDVTTYECETEQAWQSVFRSSRWFTRGWTLQELLAPKSVEFFSREERLLGDKNTLEKLIHEITNIPVAALHGAPLSDFSVDERLLWAAERKTKKEEDKAYCLMGIFNVFMPPIYGEEENAFRRLRQEIEKLSGNKSNLPPLPSSTVPFRRDVDFVDRHASSSSKTLLEQIEERCAPPAARVALVGIGGAGKSQLAIEYCHRRRELSSHLWVFWIYAGSVGRIEQGYREIAERMKIPRRDDAKVNIFELVTRWLQDESHGMWLLVLDNLDDISIVSRSLEATARRIFLLSYLPQSANGTILLTTRTSAVAVKLVEPRDVIAVSQMTNVDATILLKKKLDKPADDHDLEELARLLEYMPLAIVQAAAYIREKGARCSVRKYIERFQRSENHKTSLLNHEAGNLRRDPGAQNSVIITWQISFDDIREKWPAAAHLLSLMSYFDRQGIPQEVLKVQPEEDDRDEVTRQDDLMIDDEKDETENVESNSASKTSDDDVFEEAVERLTSYSFVSMSEDGYTFGMHGLVQLATREWLKMHGEEEKWKGQFLRKLNALYPNGEYENWDRCKILFPHAKAAEKQRPTDIQSLREWAEILRMAAWYARERGDSREAERMCEKSLDALEIALGREDVETSYSLSLLASIYESQGRWTEAEKLVIEVLETRRRVLGREHPDTLISMNNLALTYKDLGRWTEAEKIQKEVLETWQRVLGEDDPDTLLIMNNLAVTYQSQGRGAKADKIWKEVLETRRRVLGDEHPDTLLSMNNLAMRYHDQERWAEAVKIQEEVLEIGRRVQGDEHPDTLISMNNLALTYKHQGRWIEAEKIQEEVLQIKRRVLGKEHPGTLISMSNLASIYASQRRWTEAEKIMIEVLETERRVLGREHPKTLLSMHNLALTYWSQGRLAEAEKIEIEVLETRRKVLGREHPDTLTSMHNLADTMEALGRRKDAIELMNECVRLRNKILGTDHRHTLSSAAYLAKWNDEEADRDGEEVEWDDKTTSSGFRKRLKRRCKLFISRHRRHG